MLASDFQNMQSAMRSSGPRPQMFGSMRPSSQLPRMTANQRVGKFSPEVIQPQAYVEEVVC